MRCSHKNLANCSPYQFSALQDIKNLATVNLNNLNSLIKSVLRCLIFAFLFKKTKMFTKPPTRALRYIIMKSFFEAPWSFTHVFKKFETTIRWNSISKALRFLQATAQHQDCPVFTVFLTIKTWSQNISITLI